MADTGDVLATLVAWGHLPKAGRLLVLAAAGGAVAVARLTSPPSIRSSDSKRPYSLAA